MADRTTPPAPRITRKQAVVLAVLSASLVAALMFNSPSDNSRKGNAALPNESARLHRSAASTNATEWKPNWPNVSLDQMLHHNPFAAINIPTEEPASNDSERLVTAAPTEILPDDSNTNPEDEATTARRRKSEEALAAFQSQKVKLTLRSGGKVSALIGNRLVHEGEIIDGLLRIVSILPTGVLVETITTEQ